jgi:hypothetical protein
MPWEIFGDGGPWVSVDSGIISLDDPLLRRDRGARAVAGV